MHAYVPEAGAAAAAAAAGTRRLPSRGAAKGLAAWLAAQHQQREAAAPGARCRHGASGCSCSCTPRPDIEHGSPQKQRAVQWPAGALPGTGAAPTLAEDPGCAICLDDYGEGAEVRLPELPLC